MIALLLLLLLLTLQVLIPRVGEAGARLALRDMALGAVPVADALGRARVAGLGLAVALADLHVDAWVSWVVSNARVIHPQRTYEDRPAFVAADWRVAGAHEVAVGLDLGGDEGCAEGGGAGEDAGEAHGD